MSIFMHILSYNIVPIFILIFLGYMLNKKFNLNIYTLSKLNFYLFVPCFIFVNLYTANIAVEMLKVLAFGILLLIINDIISVLIAKIRNYDKSLRNAFRNSVMFYNSGNIGLPLITLIFSSAPFIINGQTPYLNAAVTAQIMIMVLQNITTNTFGFFNAGRVNMHWKDSIRRIAGMPTVYAIPIAFLFKNIPYDLTKAPLWAAIVYVKNGLVPVALITLGVQLSRTNISFKNKEVYISVIARLIGGPLMALVLVYAMGFSGIAAQTILISSSVPTSVNTALIAVEYDNCEEFASQSVMISTMLSAFTLTMVIYASRILFPVA